MRCGGGFVIYEIWGGDFCKLNVLKFGIDLKNFCYFGIKTFDALSTPSFVTKFIEHIYRTGDVITKITFVTASFPSISNYSALFSH